MHTSTRGSRRAALVAAATLALLVPACGGAAGTGSGDPIKVMLISQLDAAGFSFPEIESMTRAAIKPVNDAGGIGGRRVELEVCNDQLDPNRAAACARQASGDGVALVLAPFSTAGGSVLPVLEQAGIAYAGNAILTPDDGTSPDSFPLVASTPATGAAVGAEFVKHGCTRAGSISADDATSNAYLQYLEQGMRSAGGELVSKARIGAGTPDYAPALATALADGATCVFLALPASESAKALAAVVQSPTRPLLGAGKASLPAQVLAGVPADAVEGAILVSTAYSAADDLEPVKRMTAEATAAGVTDEQLHGPYAVQAWAATTIAMEAMRGIQGTVDAQSVLAAMGRIQQPASGPLGAFSTTTEFTAPGLNRLFNRNTLTYTVRSGVARLESPEWHDMSSVLTGSPS